MAKMYYNLEETLARLGLTEDKLKALVREGKLREFRDAGKLNYRVDEVERLSKEEGAPLSLGDSDVLPLAPPEEDTPSASRFGKTSAAPGGSGSGFELGTDASGLKIDEGTGDFKLSDSGGSGGISLSDSGGGSDSSGVLALEDSGSGSGVISLEDSGGGSGPTALSDSGPAAGQKRKPSDSGSGSDLGRDIVSLDEVDKSAVEGMKKDDTVITNIGISVFDDDDLEIAADPMAKTLMTGGDEHLGLDGSGGGSGLLELTRESDDTSLGAELLEGIDMGDTAETALAATGPTVTEPAPEEPAEALPAAEESFAPAAVAMPMVIGTVEAASPAFTGLLISGTLVMGLLMAANVAMAFGTCPGYLLALTEQFWFLLLGCLLVGGLGAGIGWFVGNQASKPRIPKPPKEKKDKKAGKGKAAPAAG
ncbi:MAG TPA: hypothetical protein PLL20_03485 [Phycisphaerae bacterium]|nr:hypothetical protein [Phycisphaerae bacterium]HRR84286.1 hypothetical protein [Phycisphaerae bacterium]